MTLNMMIVVCHLIDISPYLSLALSLSLPFLTVIGRLAFFVVVDVVDAIAASVYYLPALPLLDSAEQCC